MLSGMLLLGIAGIGRSLSIRATLQEDPGMPYNWLADESVPAVVTLVESSASPLYLDISSDTPIIRAKHNHILKAVANSESLSFSRSAAAPWWHGRGFHIYLSRDRLTFSSSSTNVCGEHGAIVRQHKLQERRS